MASFESKVSDIFSENPKLARKLPVVIRQLFHESESEFKRRMRNEAEHVVQAAMLRLFDILFIDFYFDKLDDRFMNWVIDHYAERFTDSELDEMRAQADSNLDFYEVQDVVPGQGCYIKSLCSSNEGFLRDVSSSSKLVKWDITLSRCYYFKGEYYATGAFTLFSPADKKFIQERIEKACSEFTDNFQETEYSDFAKNRWEVFYQIEQEITTKAMNKKYYTTYGELQLCDVRFRVQNIQIILDKIKICDEFSFVETKIRKDKNRKRNVSRYRFDWITLGIENKLDTIKTKDIKNGFMLQTQQLDINGNQMDFEPIGTLYVDKFLCRLEIRSYELAEFAVRHFTQLFGDALIFKRIIKLKHNIGSKQDVEKKKTETPNLNQQDPDLHKKVGEKLFLDLLDKKIPALNNLSPREARQDIVARPLLIEWLKGLENIFERKRLAGKQTISIEKIKEALDIDW